MDAAGRAARIRSGPAPTGHHRGDPGRHLAHPARPVGARPARTSSSIRAGDVGDRRPCPPGRGRPGSPRPAARSRCPGRLGDDLAGRSDQHVAGHPAATRSGPRPCRAARRRGPAARPAAGARPARSSRATACAGQAGLPGALAPPRPAGRRWPSGSGLSRAARSNAPTPRPRARRGRGPARRRASSSAAVLSSGPERGLAEVPGPAVDVRLGAAPARAPGAPRGAGPAWRRRRPPERTRSCRKVSAPSSTRTSSAGSASSRAADVTPPAPRTPARPAARSPAPAAATSSAVARRRASWSARRAKARASEAGTGTGASGRQRLATSASSASSIRASGLPPVAAHSRATTGPAPAAGRTSSTSAPESASRQPVQHAGTRQPGLGHGAGVALPDGGQQHDRVGGQPSRGEAQRLGGRAVEQVRVVDQHGDRLVLGQPAEQAQGGRADREPVPAGARAAAPARTASASACGCRDPVQLVQRRGAAAAAGRRTAPRTRTRPRWPAAAAGRRPRGPAASSSSALLPMPASPTSTRAPLSPDPRGGDQGLDDLALAARDRPARPESRERPRGVTLMRSARPARRRLESTEPITSEEKPDDHHRPTDATATSRPNARSTRTS